MAMEVKVREEAMKCRAGPYLLWFRFGSWRSEQELCVGHELRGWRAGLQGRACPSGCVTLRGSPDPSQLHFPSSMQGDRRPGARQP